MSHINSEVIVYKDSPNGIKIERIDNAIRFIKRESSKLIFGVKMQMYDIHRSDGHGTTGYIDI